ncbi:hypothetical protein ACOMHN_004065 [Nucella lapillus]
MDEAKCGVTVEEVQRVYQGRFEQVSKTVDLGLFPPPKRRMEAGDLQGLCEPITPEEVRSARKSTKAMTAAGPDGVAAYKLKSKVGDGELLVTVFNTWLTDQTIPQYLKESRSILLPKGKKDLNLSGNWRPLTISSILLRLYSKVLAKRLTAAVPLNLIQRGFIPAPGVSENTQLLARVIKQAKARKGELAVAFLDLAKAFDTVLHDLVRKGMQRFGVPDFLVNVVADMYEGAKTTFTVKGGQTEPITIGSGVKQGDPLSPILFDMALDPLLCLLKTEGEPWKIGRTNLTAMGYADDTAVMSRNSPGIKVDIEPDASAWEYLQLFVDDELLNQMVEQTSLYAAQYKAAQYKSAQYKAAQYKAAQYKAAQYKAALGRAIKPHNLLAGWTDITTQELKVFLGLLFLMGIVDKPDIKSYWSTNPYLKTPIFGKSMSRNRFEAILMAFHLNDNTQNLPRDDPGYKLFKIQPLLSKLQDRFAAVYHPRQNLSIDESMMPWRGRVGFRQFIPSKPVRYGIKMYLYCESDSPYVCRMEIYCGRRWGQREKDHGPNVVKWFSENFHGKGHTIFIDSFFSSVGLFRELGMMGTTATGTIRKDRRGLPTQLGEKKLQKGQTAEMKCDITANEVRHHGQ